MKILTWDVETSPLNVYTWGLWQQNVAIGQIKEAANIMCVGAKWYDERKTMMLRGEHMIEDLWELLDRTDVSVTYNGKNFDQKHAHREFAEHKPTLGRPSPYQSVDLLQVVRNKFRFPSNKLDYVAQRLIGARKTPGTSFELWKGCMADDPASWLKMEKYCMNDVRIEERLYTFLLPWIDHHPAIPLHDGYGDVLACPRCGSSKQEKRGFHYTSVGSYQRYLCKGCSGWYHGPTRLSTTQGR